MGTLDQPKTEKTTVSTAVPRTLFKDLQERPAPAALIGVRDSQVLEAGKAAGLPTQDPFLSTYVHNLIGLLPYYEQIVKTLAARARKGDIVVCLARDFDPIYDGLCMALAGTGFEKNVIRFPISGELRENLGDESKEVRRFLGQYIDLQAALKGTTKYLAADTGFMGNTFDWINRVIARSNGATPENMPTLPIVVRGVLIRSQGQPAQMFGGEFCKPRYPQFKLRQSGYEPKDFIFPGRIYSARNSFQSDINYAVAAATQLMPKYHDHTCRIEKKGGILRPLAADHTKESLGLSPLESIELDSMSPGFFARMDWKASVCPVAATRLQAFVVNYFAAKYTLDSTVRERAKDSVRNFTAAFSTLFQEDLTPKARQYVAAKEAGFDRFLNDLEIADFANVYLVHKVYMTNLPPCRSWEQYVQLKQGITTIHPKAIQPDRRAMRWYLNLLGMEVSQEFESVCDILKERIAEYRGAAKEMPARLRSSLRSDLREFGARLNSLQTDGVKGYFKKRSADPQLPLKLASWPQASSETVSVPHRLPPTPSVEAW